MRMLRRAVLSSVVAFAALAGAGPAMAAPAEATERVTMDRVAAVVGDEIILVSQLARAASRSPLLQEALATLPPSTPDEVVQARRREVEARVLDELIDLQLIKAEAERFELTATEADIDNALPNVAQSYGLTVEELRAQVVASDEYESWAEYREDLRDQILHYKVTSYLGQWSVSDAQVREHYRKMTRDERAKVEVRQFVFSTASGERAERDQALARATAVTRRLRAGESADDIATAIGYDGTLPRTVGRGEVAPSLEEAIFAAKEGGVVGPLGSGQGYVVFKIIAHQASGALSFAKAKDRIRAQLEQEAIIKAEQELKRQLRAKAHIDIRL